ncbi:hypothetical protein P167DRAFT_281345 [Morchella conica CCBAS932]|uniref:FAD-binding FR-type domain-containing protein n=1 Tax=Morchella conica CCBAS932 TaxID=1392247 RepID=A0A3N4KL59_9PEZI|nr:hypothetical protein P167DRAFT_281345 [Morchella conica CCBAS932]
MYATTVYVISIGCVFLLWVFFTAGLATVLSVYKAFISTAYNHLARQTPQLLRGNTNVTRTEALLYLVYIIGNIIAVFVEDLTRKGIQSRAGFLALINMAPLVLVGRPNSLVNSYMISQRTQERLHTVIGYMVLVQSVIHTAIGISMNQNQRSFTGYLAVGGITFLCVFMAKFCRSLAFEAFRALHVLVALLVLVSLSLHVQITRIPLLRTGPSICVFVIVALWAALIVFRVVRSIFSSLGARAYVIGHEKDDGIVQIVVDFRNPWFKFQPGQFMYITIPSISSSAVLQSHPFQLVWWDQPLSRAFFLVRPGKGFTRNLLHHRSAWMSRGESTEDPIMMATTLRTIVEGPYGLSDLKLGSYGTVLMVATGLGIASQLPYIKHLLDAHHSRSVTTQKIKLFWEVQMEGSTHTHTRTLSFPRPWHTCPVIVGADVFLLVFQATDTGFPDGWLN